MRKSGKVAIALAISIPLVLLGGGLAVAADQLPGLQTSVPGDASPSASLGNRLALPCIFRAGFTDATRDQAREWCSSGSCSLNQLRNCGEECYLARECPVDCPRVAEGGDAACCTYGDSGTRLRGACGFRGAPQAETTRSTEYNGCSRCDSEPLNEYPPNSPWYTGNQ